MHASHGHAKRIGRSNAERIGACASTGSGWELRPEELHMRRSRIMHPSIKHPKPASKHHASETRGQPAHLLPHVIGAHIVAVHAQVWVALLHLPRLDLRRRQGIAEIKSCMNQKRAPR